tara:strand:- start:210 stop:800 length:591 start_codon:yes stop_codon:yes gene_type:complete
MKVLLVGNGPSALESPMGSRIDSDEFDAVLRFNRGHKLDDGTLNTGFEEQTGTKCDYWVASDLRIQLAIERCNDYKGIFIVTPKFKWNEDVVRYVNEKHPQIQFIPPAYEDDINSIVDFSPKWPSTGVVGIHFAVNHFEEVYIYGFDTYDFKYDNLHYFENKPNKFKFNQTPDHNPDKEKYYIDYMVNNNKIKILT